MNKVFKVIWNEARNAYVVVSEIAKNHGSKSCSTKKLLAMLIATGVMTCASFDVLAAEPSGTDTAKSQYVAFADPTHTLYSGNKTTIDGHEYIYDATNKYWVRKGYKLVVEENGAMHTPLSDHGKSSDVAYIGNGDKDSILQSVASMVSASGTVTNMGESLNKITASGFVGVSHSGGTAADGTWHYIIHDPTWEGAVVQGNYEDGYVDLVGKNMPKGFVTADDNKGLIWDDDKQAYNYKGKPVDYSNVYVIDGKIGVFTNKDGSDFYEGTVFGKNNEILMTVKDDNGHFYSYWASAVTDPSATMSTYRLAEYKKDLSVLVENDEKLSRNDIKEVTLDTTQANSATICLLRNGDTEAGAPVKGAITVTSGGGTGGSGAANDTFVKISNGTANQTFATGSKVEVNGPANAITGIKVNGVDYTIKQGSGVKVEQDATKKTTTITVDGTATTITDNDTTYTAGDGIEISSANAISVSKNLTGMQSITGAGGKIDFTGDKVTINEKVTIDSTGAFYAASNKFSVDKDGNMNANSVQTNALNSKYNLSVGTANENGTVPFFVNSNGAFYAANGKLVVDKDGKLVAPEAELGKVTADEGVIGNVVLKDGVFYKHTALRDGELFVGDASGNYSQITTKGAKLGKVTIAEDGKISGVAAGEVSSTSTDAINGSQLHQTNENVAALDKRVTQNEADIATNKANIAQNAADIAANKANIAQNAADIATNKANIAQNKADIAQNKADIAQNKTDIKNLDNRVTNVEELAKKHTTVTAGDNITVTEDKNKDGGKEYKVALDKDINLDSVTTGQTVMNKDGLKIGKDVSVTATAVTEGKTSISDEGVKVGDKTYISDKGLNANDKKVTNVAAGELSETSKDAVNGSQLYKTNQAVVNNTNRINKLGSRVNKVGAGAAALAALHPMDFDPDDKLTFSAGYGNYAGENAAAIGAYYRPDEKVMFSVAGTVGNGENMVNAGVSFALDRTNHVSNSRTALAREVIDLRGQLAVMGAKMAKMEKAFGMLDETKTKLFPDVPANHWAYEYIAKLAGNGYIEGYPDGNFGGDRLMTRYEFAAMLYRAIENGAALEEKIIKEFEPELGRIRVDRISGEDGDRDKIERVRVNDTKGERDHYGNKLAK